MKDAVMPVKVIGLQTAAVPVKVGYVMGMGDMVPPALQQLGADVKFIDADELAFGDLSKYDVVMLGVRAYHLRDDLGAYNQRILDYAKNGGTVLVNYNKGEFNGFGPYPGGTTGGGRVNDETAEVKVSCRIIPCSTSRTRSAPRIGPAGRRSAGSTCSASPRATRTTSRSCR
jgi:hypothetical protein